MFLMNVFFHGFATLVRLSPTMNPYGHPNPKWVARDLKSAFNRVPIREIYFGLTKTDSNHETQIQHLYLGLGPAQ